MNEYRVMFTASAEREVESLDGSIIRRIYPRIADLASNPRPSGCVKLADAANRWRIRVGDYRVIYEIDDSLFEVVVVRVRHRRDAYRR